MLRLLRLVLLRFHCRKQEHFLDIIRVREEHDKSVHSQPEAPGGRQAVLQRRAEVLVY